MFIITDDDAAAIRAALDDGGELSAAVEMRRRFPALSMEWARDFIRKIAPRSPPDTEAAGER